MRLALLKVPYYPTLSSNEMLVQNLPTLAPLKAIFFTGRLELPEENNIFYRVVLG